MKITVALLINFLVVHSAWAFDISVPDGVGLLSEGQDRSLISDLVEPKQCQDGGHVDMEFTVDVEGMARGPVVIEEVPEACGFANSAMKALPKWRFKPEVKDGKPIPSKARYRISFKMSGSSATPAEASPQTGKPAASPR